MKNSINLLPNTYRRKRIIRNYAMGWMLAVLAACVAVGYEAYLEHQAHQADLHGLHTKQQQYASTNRKKRELPNLQKRLIAVSKRQPGEPIAPAADHALNLLGIVERCVKEGQGQLWIEDFAMMTQPPNKIESSNECCRITLRGKAQNNLVVASLVAALREADVFHRVELNPSNSSSEQENLRDYSVNCLH